jgi:hypothetical protein
MSDPAIIDPRFRFVPLPKHSSLGSSVVRNIGGYLAIVAMVASSIAVSLVLARGSVRIPLPVLLGAAIMPTVAYLLATLIGHLSAMRSSRAERASLDGSDAHQWSARVYDCIARDPLTLSREGSARAWRAMLDASAGGPRPIAIIDERLRDTLAAPTRELLEAESIEPSQSGLLIVSVMFLALATISIFGGLGNRSWNVVIFVTLSLYFASRHPPVRNALPILRNTGRDLIAGPGWVAQNKKGNRWTVDDSLLILFRRGARTSAAKTAIVVRLIGPPGVRDIHFASPEDPDFRMLWERWATEQPRLELG